jgi:tRNA(Ile)-lysidine synthase
MDEINGNYVRPLLKTSKQDMILFLDTNKIDYLKDPTNASDKYLRNRIRNYVIPALQKCDNRFNHKFQTMLDAIKQEDNFLNDLANKFFNKIFHKNTQNKFVGNLEIFRSIHETLQRRIVVLWLISEHVHFKSSTAFIDEILRFLRHPTGGQHSINSTMQIYKKQKSFWVDKKTRQHNS